MFENFTVVRDNLLKNKAYSKLIILATSKEILVTAQESSSEETADQSKYLNIQFCIRLSIYE